MSKYLKTLAYVHAQLFQLKCTHYNSSKKKQQVKITQNYVKMSNLGMIWRILKGSLMRRSHEAHAEAEDQPFSPSVNWRTIHIFPIMLEKAKEQH